MDAASSDDLQWLLDIVHKKCKELKVRPELMTDTSVYGGFPRDLLRGTPPTD